MSTASVKVMRSYDYCHFEVCLGSGDKDLTLDEVDDLRKQAAVLADEAVRQYKKAKAAESERDRKKWEIERAISDLEAAKQAPESELTPQQAALLRADADKTFWDPFDRDSYFYDDPEREQHFSMLDKFKASRVHPVNAGEEAS